MGVAYSQIITANGGTAPYTFAIREKVVAGGITISKGGLLTGTPTIANNNFSFTIIVSDNSGNISLKTYSINVKGNPTGKVNNCNEATLRSTIDSTAIGGTVAFSCSGTITLANQIYIYKNLTLEGSGQQITLDGQHKTGVFQVNSGVAFTIKDLNITNGQFNYFYGGGILNSGTLTVIRTTS